MSYILGSIAFFYAIYLFFFTPFLDFSLFFLVGGFLFYSYFHFSYEQGISCVFSVIFFTLLYTKFVLFNLVNHSFYLSIFATFIPAILFLGLYLWKKHFSLYLRQLYLYLSFFTSIIFGIILFSFVIVPFQTFVVLVYGFLLTVLLFTLFFVHKYVA